MMPAAKPAPKSGPPLPLAHPWPDFGGLIFVATRPPPSRLPLVSGVINLHKSMRDGVGHAKGDQRLSPKMRVNRPQIASPSVLKAATSRIRPGKRGAFSSPGMDVSRAVTGWWRSQSAANPSPGPFPDLQGIIREFSTKAGAWPGQRFRNERKSLHFSRQFPTQGIREFSQQNREVKIVEQGTAPV